MRLLILTYHYVRPAGGPYAGIHPITSHALRTQLQLLANVMHAATPDEVTDFVRGGKTFSRDAFFVTFDDGLVDHLAAAIDVLAPLGLRAAFFVPTRPLSEKRSPAVHKLHWLRAHTEPGEFFEKLARHLPEPWNNYKMTREQRDRAAKMHIHDTPDIGALKFMLNFLIPHDVVDEATSRMLNDYFISEAEFCAQTFLDAGGLRELETSGHVVGCHGHMHAPLSSFNAAACDADVAENSRVLSETLGQRPAWISYPYGREDALPADCAALCQRHGFELGFTMLPGWNQVLPDIDRWKLRRITPNELGRWLPDANK